MPSDAMRVWDAALGAYERTSNKAAAAVIERAIADAVEQERARVVKWLRRRITWDENPNAARFKLADAIERGDHKERADG